MWVTGKALYFGDDSWGPEKKEDGYREAHVVWS